MLEAVNLQAVREGDGGAVSVAFLKSQTQQMQDVKGGENLRTSCYYFPVSTMMGGAHHVLYLAEICGCIPGRMALSKVSYSRHRGRAMLQFPLATASSHGEDGL